MKFKALLLLSLPLLLWTCKDDPVDPQEDGPPQVTVTADRDASSPVCVGQSVVFTVSVSADELIDDLVISKDGAEISGQEDVFVNNFTFTLTYPFSSADLAAGSVTFDFTATDLNGKSGSETLTYQVVAEYAYDSGSIEPTPSWNLVSNVALVDEMGAEVDMRVLTETEPCGIGCVRVRYTFISGNDTRFYSIDGNMTVNTFTNAFKQADVVAAIASATEETSILAYSEFMDDQVGGANLDIFPLVAHIRGSGEYAIIGPGLEAGQFTYKKRSENAGG